MPRPPKGMFKRGPVWYTRVWCQGRDHWVSLSRDFDKACGKLKKIRSDGTPLSRMRVKEAVERWLATYIRTARNPQNRKLAKDRAEQYLIPRIGHMFVDKLTADDVRLYRVALEDTHLSVQTVVHLLSDLRCFFNWCEDTGLVVRSPVPRKILPRVQERPPDRLTDEEVDRLIVLPDPYGFVIRLGLATGLRWSELCRVQRSDVRDGVLTVHRTKSGKIRRIPLDPAILKELRNRIGRLVPFATGSPGSFSKIVRRESGVERFHPHQLRHTFGCRWWLEWDGRLAVLQAVHGHASIVTTQRYARLTEDAVRQEAMRVQSVAISVAD